MCGGENSAGEDPSQWKSWHRLHQSGVGLCATAVSRLKEHTRPAHASCSRFFPPRRCRSFSSNQSSFIREHAARHVALNGVATVHDALFSDFSLRMLQSRTADMTEL